MENFVSTVKQPIKFFEDLIIEGGYELFRNEFFADWERVERDETWSFFVRICKEENYIVHYFQSLIDDAKADTKDIGKPDENKQTIKKQPFKLPKLYDEISVVTGDANKGKRLNLKDVLNYRLKQEEIYSKKLIQQAISEIAFNGNKPDYFLNQQAQILQSFINIDSEIFNRSAVLINHLQEIKNFIDGIQSQDLISDVSKLESRDYKTALIHEIFDFWKLPTHNGKGPEIMTLEEHHRLISLITDLIKNEKVPEIKKKFEPLPIPKYLITFCFYVLKKKLFGNSRGKKYFTEFLKNAFVDFENYSEDTFKRKFATKPILIEKWYPKIIQDSIMAE